MIRDLGIVEPGKTLYIPFHTFDSNDPSASVTLTGLATTDIEIYKDGSTTQRASDSGYALLDTDGIDFDAITGIHGISIDLADNSTAGFYAAGSQYWVVISSITVDAATINFVLCTFRIGYPAARLNTTIATLSSQTSFTLTAGPAEDDALNGCWCVIHDVASAVQHGHALILDYTGSTKTVTLAAGTTFTAAASDNIAIMGLAPMQPTVTGRTLDVSTGGEAGIDWANIGSPTTAVNLSATNIDVDQVVASVSGNVTGSVGSIASGGISEASYATTAGSFAPLGIFDQGTAQAATSTTLQLRSAAAFADNTLVGCIALAFGSTQGYWQAREITAYVGSTDTATVDAWSVTPSGTVTYRIIGGPPASSTGIDLIFDEQVDGSVTFRQSIRLQNSAAAGKASGMGTTTATLRDLADTKDRIVATVDSSGNRTAVTRDVS